jgi:hypothetical protein
LLKKPERPKAGVVITLNILVETSARDLIDVNACDRRLFENLNPFQFDGSAGALGSPASGYRICSERR